MGTSSLRVRKNPKVYYILGLFVVFSLQTTLKGTIHDYSIAFMASASGRSVTGVSKCRRLRRVQIQEAST